MRIKKKKMICFDGEGNQLGETEDIPEPEIVTYGLRALPGYFTQLFAFASPFSLLIVLTSDEKRAIAVARQEGETQLLLSLDWRKYADLERALRGFLLRHRLSPAHDYLANDNDVRHLDYPLPNSAEQACAICQGVLVECYGVEEHDILKFMLR